MTNLHTGAVLIHPRGDYTGNLLWPGTLPSKHLDALPAAVAAMRARGYWASPFPEGDGVTFKTAEGTYVGPEAMLADFRAVFEFLEIEALDPDEGQARALARLAVGRTASCTYLVRMEGMRLEECLKLGETRWHAPVDGLDVRLADHSWRELCDVPGADVNPEWAPGDRATGTTELLGYPLIERKIELPLAVFYEADSSFGPVRTLADGDGRCRSRSRSDPVRPLPLSPTRASAGEAWVDR